MQTPYGDNSRRRWQARAGEMAGGGADGGNNTDGGDGGDGGWAAVTPAEYQTTPLCSRQSRQRDDFPLTSPTFNYFFCLKSME